MREGVEVDQMVDLVVALEDAGTHPVSEIGGKAHGLSQVIEAGLPVPRGVVLTTAATRLFLEENRLGREATPEDATRGTMPDDLMALLKEVRLGLDGPVAVRSSATAEDLSGSSYAGQYETVLGVNDLEQLTDAVRSCWASVFGARVSSYRLGKGGADTEMAVVIQEMVPARCAGVAFTVDPVTGADQVFIEAAAGLGHKVVAGEVAPERWIMPLGGTIERSDEGPAVLTAEEAAAIAQQARHLAALAGSPQDVEWAIAGGEVWILQSRPITALPVVPEIEVPEAQTWIREDEYYPEPVKPLEYSAWFPLQDQIFAEAFAELGLPLRTMEHRRIGGRVYMRVVPVGDTGRERTPPPPLIFGLLFRLVPALRERAKAATAARDLPVRAVEDWESRGRSALRARAAELRGRDLASRDSEALAAHIEEVMTHFGEALREHFRLVFSSVYVATGQLGLFLEGKLGWGPEKAIGLLQGYGYHDEADALETLVRAIWDDPEGKILLENDPTALLEHSGGGGEALRSYLEGHGHRMIGLYLSYPTYAEDPRPLLSMLHEGGGGGGPSSPSSDVGRALEAEARAELANRPGRVEEFERLLERARRGHPYGDATEPDVGGALALIRYASVEAGHRLSRDGVLPDADAVHFLTVDELLSALRRGDTDVDVSRRRGEHRWALANPLPKSYGPPPTPPPDVRYVPEESRAVIGGFAWSMRNLFPPPLLEDEEAGLRGLPASPGRASGEVRVITSAAEFPRVKKGDVLVCPSTMASWTVVFPLVSAVVTEHGGPLSHPAILAREFGIPAVVGVPGATTRLHEGERVTVDGGRGVVLTAEESSKQPMERKPT